jgi:uncharacterized protein DUF4352
MNEINPNEPTGQMSHRDAKAQAKAAKAYAKAQRPWFKKKRFIIPGGFVALMMIVAMTSGGGSEEPAAADDTSTTAAADSTEAQSAGASEADASESEDTTPGLKTPVRDGKFEFTVKSFECGEDKIGASFMAERAQGQFCIAKVKVSNIGDESQMFDGTSQYLYDQEGREFTASTEAAFALPESQSFLEDINPGNTVSGKVVWDVPASGFEASELELHDSMFSEGVEVSLS